MGEWLSPRKEAAQVCILKRTGPGTPSETKPLGWKPEDRLFAGSLSVRGTQLDLEWGLADVGESRGSNRPIRQLAGSSGEAQLQL